MVWPVRIKTFIRPQNWKLEEIFVLNSFISIKHSAFVWNTERYPTKYTRSVKVQISSGMNDVIDVICTLLLRKYPSIDAVYEYSVPCSEDNLLACNSRVISRRSKDRNNMVFSIIFGEQKPITTLRNRRKYILSRFHNLPARGQYSKHGQEIDKATYD